MVVVQIPCISSRVCWLFMAFYIFIKTLQITGQAQQKNLKAKNNKLIGVQVNY